MRPRSCAAQAIADAVEREGAAEAAAILARGQAEAKSMDARAEAFATYGEAAILDLLVKVLPDVVGAAAAPLSAVDKMTVISADGAGSLGRSVAANVAQGLQLSGDLTGIDVAALLRRLGGAAGAQVATASRTCRSRRTATAPGNRQRIPPPEPGRPCRGGVEIPGVACGHWRDLPDVPVGVAEAGRPDAPRPIHGAVEQLDPARGQLGADRVDVGDPERQLEAWAVDRAARRRGIDQLRRRRRSAAG